MKSDYVEQQQHQHKITNSPQNMFSKLHQHPHHQHQHQHQHQHHHPFSHHFQLSRDSQQAASEEDTHSHNSAATTTPPPPHAGSASAGGAKSRHQVHQEHTNTTATGGDGATIEVIRRPRGRPPGSKNKPKPPVFITREPEPGMSPYILEVPGGNDVVETVSNFCRRRGIGICVLTGSGTVANVTLRQPSATPGSTITFHGRFDILSISATFLPQSTSTSFPPVPNIFAISLAGPQGQIVGGSVVGPLVAAGTVFVIAATFNSPSYHRLPVQEEQQQRTSVSAGGNEGQSPVGSSGGGGGGVESGHVAGGESCGGMSMYSCHLPPAGGDVIWAPTARQPPPY